MTAFPKPTKRVRIRKPPKRRSKPIAKRSRPRGRSNREVNKLIRRADRLFSALILRRAVCEICHRRPSTDTAHHISRTFKAVRWALENASAACRECHQAYTLEPDAWRDWWEYKVGEKVARDLWEEARMIGPITEAYMVETIEYLKGLQ